MEAQWPQTAWAPFGFCGPQLSANWIHKTRTAGIIGFGRISQATLARLIPFGFTDCVYTSSPSSKTSPEVDAQTAKKYNLRSVRRVGLDELAAQQTAGRRAAVLGDMLELGSDSESLHRAVGAEAAAAGVELLVTVGPRAVAMLDTFDGESYAVADAEEAAALVGELIEPGDVVLVKGSRGVGLEVVAEALQGAVHG